MVKANVVQSNISGLTLFLAKYLSGKNDIVITPRMNSSGYSVGRRKLPGGQVVYDINVPHWATYKLPLDDKSKYRIYRSGVWHEAQHVKHSPDQVFTFGTDRNDQAVVTEPLAHDVINIIEDRRIEDLGVEDWRGYASERLFSNAYAWTRRMDVGEFWDSFLKNHYDDTKGEYEKDSQSGLMPNYLRERRGHMRHEAFLQRLLVMKIKGSDHLSIKERDTIEHEVKMVEKELAKLKKEKDRNKIFYSLRNLTLQVIRDLELMDYVPPITRVGESSWDQSFQSHPPQPGEKEETRTGIDDYFDELMSIEVMCTDCGKHYTKKYGVREE